MRKHNGSGFLVAAVFVFAAVSVLSCDNDVGLFGGGSGFKVKVSSEAWNVFFSDPGIAEGGTTVTVYSRVGKPKVVSDGNVAIAVEGGDRVIDAAILDKFGVDLLYKYTFIMPEEPVTVFRAAASDVSQLIKSVKFEYMNRPESAENIADGDQIYGTSDRPYWSDGAPSQSIRKRRVTPGLAVKVTAEGADGVELTYILDGGAEQPCQGTIDVGAVDADKSKLLEIRAKKDGETAAFMYKLVTTDNLGDDATLSLIEVNDGTTKTTYDAASLAAIAGIGTTVAQGYVVSTFPYSVNNVTVMARVSDDAASIQAGNGGIISGAAYSYYLSGVGEDSVNKIKFVVTAEDGYTQNAYELWLMRDLSGDSSLINIKIDAKGGNWGFDPEKLLYDFQNDPVFPNITAVILTPVPADINAKVSYDDGSGYVEIAHSGDPVIFQLKKVGTSADSANVIKFKVVAQDGGSRIYELRLFRADLEDVDAEYDKIPLTQLSILPGPQVLNLANGLTNFDLAENPFPNTQEKVTVRVSIGTIPAASGRVVINAQSASGQGSAVIDGIDGVADLEIPFAQGRYGTGPANATEIVITVYGGKRESVYTVKVYRVAGDEAGLSSLKLIGFVNNGSDEYEVIGNSRETEGNAEIYNLDDPALYAPNGLKRFKVTAVPIDPNAEVSMGGLLLQKDANGVRYTSESNYVSIGDHFGNGDPILFTLKVKAANNRAIKEYKVHVYREISSDASLVELATRTLGTKIDFNSGNLSYFLNSAEKNGDMGPPLEYIVESVALTIKASNEYAKITVNSGASGSSAVSLGTGGPYTWVLSEPVQGHTVGQSGLGIVVTAQSGQTKTYTLVVYRNPDKKNNVALKDIYATMEGEEYARAPARVYPYFETSHPREGYKLYSPYFASSAGTKIITVAVVSLGSKQEVSLENEKIEYNFPENTRYWTEHKLENPVTITVKAEDCMDESGAFTKNGTIGVYKVTHLVLTPGLEAKRVPFAKGGEITFLPGASGTGRWDEVHYFKPASNGTSLEEKLDFLSYAPTTERVVDKIGRVLVNGGGGAGGKGMEGTSHYGGFGGGGGGGGGGKTILDDDFRFNKNSIEVRAGRGGNTDVGERGEAGVSSYLGTGQSALTAEGGSGGWQAECGDRDKMGGGRIIEPTGKGDDYWVWMSPDYHDDEWIARTSEGGIGGESRNYWNFLSILGFQLGPPVAMTIVLWVIAGAMKGEMQYWVYWMLQCFGFAASIAMTEFAGLAVVPYAVGGFGGGGSKTSGNKGMYTGESGDGGRAYVSDISGESSEYGRGGDGGDTYFHGPAYGQWADKGKDGNGGNAEESDGKSGGAGRVIARFIWE